MDWTLELVVVLVTDMDRAKAFYVDQAGFDVHVDHTAGDFRVIQLTPPGSACSIALLKDSPMAPGSLHGVHLCVNDIEAARARLWAAASTPASRSTSMARDNMPGSTPSVGATPRSCHSTILTATRGWSRKSGGMGPTHDRPGRGRVRRWGVRLRGPHRAIPARTPRPFDGSSLVRAWLYKNQLRACAPAHSSSRTIGRTGVDRLSCRRATIVKPARSNIESVPL